ncbi:uncharacterized protein LOC132263107 [Phlebotomus argentipes]|uniref:uncharacterized protein LOC132263107 n=1 Tax=Phlebotomus argentipes TaxID=94469 RepID=UPI002893566C|nr:uncharacterized protein LOC132263107 [Phlebotomus argentipes]
MQTQGNRRSVMESITDQARRRQKYQKLLETANEINETMEGSELLDVITRVQKLMRQGNEVWNEQGDDDKDRTAAEVAMDLQVFKVSNEIIAKSLKTKGLSQFNENEFTNALKELLIDSNGVWYWNRLAPVWGKQMKVASNAAIPLLGTFGEIPAEQEKVVKERAKRKRNIMTEEKKPENIDKLQQTTKGGQRVNEVMRQITKIYNERGRKEIPYFELVCDPENFVKSVENAFQVSFLCREGLLDIIDDEDEEGYAYVKPMAKKNDSQIVTETTQAISSLTHDVWKQSIGKYNIKKSLLADVIESNTPGTSQSKVSRLH